MTLSSPFILLLKTTNKNQQNLPPSPTPQPPTSRQRIAGRHLFQRGEAVGCPGDALGSAVAVVALVAVFLALRHGHLAAGLAVALAGATG